ncbi:MAG: M14 family metallopeptidase, partial [Nitriliruptorales bacterium]
ANIVRLGRLKEISETLARGRIPEAEARRLAEEGTAIVWIDGGLHSTEVAHAQHTPELAHWLSTDESDEAQRIRDNVILLLMPVMNPDGLDIVVDWYRSNVGTEFEISPLPVLYQHYIGHDNNRDWYMFTQVETQAVARQLYHEWFPQIVYNHHQSGPFPGRIWIPPFEDPVNPNLDPLVVSSINQIGESMRKRFDEEGKPGVSSGITYDLWWNGSMRGGPDFHNMLGFLTETALYRYATPHCYAADDIPETFGARNDNLPAHTPSNNYNHPWRGGCWHLRDPVEYMLTASKAVLDLASKQPEDYLFNIYRMGRRQTERGARAEGGPFAYVIDPTASHDAGAAVELLRVFRIANIEIRRADRPFTAGGTDYAAGVYVIPPQAFRPFVVDLIEPKTYPERRLYPGGPPKPPYDMTGYELSLQMGVAVDRVTEPFAMPGPPIDEVPALDGGVRGATGDTWLLAPSHNASVEAVNRLLAGGADISRAARPFEAAGAHWPAGTFVIRSVGRGRLDALGRAIGVELTAVEAPPAVTMRSLRAPRIGLYKGHVATMDEGWI